MKLDKETVKSIINLICTVLSAVAACICTSSCMGSI